jgi:hypothetical protein
VFSPPGGAATVCVVEGAGQVSAALARDKTALAALWVSTRGGGLPSVILSITVHHFFDVHAAIGAYPPGLSLRPERREMCGLVV